jgi:hypothetical protein
MTGGDFPRYPCSEAISVRGSGYDSAHMFELQTRALTQAIALMQGVMAEVLLQIGELEDAGVWHGTGYSSMSRWICAHYDVTFSTAREWVRVARALRVLPAIAMSLAQGLLTFDQVRPLTLFASPETTGSGPMPPRG